MTATKQAENFSYVRRGHAEYLLYTAYDQSPVHRNRLASIVDLITTHTNGETCRIIDIGCGTGNITIPLASLGHEVHGTDLHADSIAVARERHHFPNLRFDAAGLSEIDLRQYDVVVLTEVLEHVSAYAEMFTEIARRIKNGTLLVLTIPNGRSLVEIACRPSYMLKKSPRGTRVVKAVKSALGSKDLTTANEQTPHVQFFTWAQLHDLFNQTQMRSAHSRSFFFAWPLWEVFFTTRVCEACAEWDFQLSQRLPERARAMWCFGLIKC